jgi:hypothetical protein
MVGGRSPSEDLNTSGRCKLDVRWRRARKSRDRLGPAHEANSQRTIRYGFRIEPWVLKFDGVGNDFELGTGGDYGRTEYAYYKIATEAGIIMTPCRLLEENEGAHFMTRRFDRDVVKGKTIKHHVQTLWAMNHLDYKQRSTHPYSQLFMV